MTTPTDGSEDVNDFLLRIRELGERRDKEDDERTKKLEDEILQGRKERQARRAERARSIADSPTLNSPRLSVSSHGQPSIDPPEHLEPTVQTQDPETPGGANSLYEAGALDASEARRGSVQDNEPVSPSRTLPPLSRSRTGTLSWQQRPQSRDFGSRSPGTTSPTRSSHLRNASTASDERRLSRANIASSPSSKDPPWLRRSPDRGLDSSPFRKNDARSDSQTDLGPTTRPPGLSRESTTEPEHEEETGAKSPSPPRTASTVGESNLSHHRFSSVSSASPATGLGSPVAPLSDAPKLEPQQADKPADDAMPPSPTQRRMSPERTRSTSPTKGLGGFVQSAMMKRSDSVTKRWSAQIPQGLSRSNSIVSNRSSVAVPSLGASVSDMTPTTGSRTGPEAAPLPTQRPSSSHSEATVHQAETSQSQRPTTPSSSSNNTSLRSDGSPSKSSYTHARSTSSITAESQGDGPSSPYSSRTMDPKRWSPTKASWLESALNRPADSSRTQRQSQQQPSWATQRQSRGSVDMGRVSNFKEVTPVGLMRSPAPGGHFQKPSITGPSSIFGSPVTNKPKETSPESPGSSKENREPLSIKTDLAEKPEPVKIEPVEKTKAAEEAKSPSPVVPEPEVKQQPAESEKTPGAEPSPQSPAPQSPAALSPKPNFSRPSRESNPLQTKPQSPAMDLRANLRKREVVKDSGGEAQPEFKNVFGRLKKTETRNYVAPDELKSNILRGKAALNVTGGPKKTERVDELKESLIKQKEAMKAGGGTVRRNTAGENDAPEKPAAAVPEAIAKRSAMAKSNSVRRPNADERKPSTSPEAETTRTSVENTDRSPDLDEPKPSQSPDIGTARTSVDNSVRSPTLDERKSSKSPELENARTSVEKDVRSHALDEPKLPKFPEIGAVRTSVDDTIRSPDVDEPKPSKFPEIGAARTSVDNTVRSPDVDERKLSNSAEIGTAQTSVDRSPVSPAVEEKATPEEPRARWPIANESKTSSIDLQPSPSPIPSPSSGENSKDVLDTTPPSVEKKEELLKESNSAVRGLPSARFAASRTAAPPPGLAAKGKLAGRINPALAGILSRGPPAAAEAPKSTPVTSPGDNSSASPSAPLTHVTKGRARGPKRRLPKGDTTSPASTVEPTKEVGVLSSPEVKPSQPTPEPVIYSEPPSKSQSNNSLVLDTETTQKAESPSFDQLPGVNANFQEALNSGLKGRLGEVSPISSPSSPSEPSVAFPRENLNAAREIESPVPVSPSSGPPVPPKPSSSPSPSPSTPGAKLQWSQQTRYNAASSSPLRTNYKENRRELPPTPAQKSIPGVTVADSSPRNSQQESPPVPQKRSGVSLNKPADNRLSRKMSAPSLVAQAAEARDVIAVFFKNYPNPRDRMDIDPQLMLQGKADDSKIRTVKRQIWEITGAGKRQELPINQEYVLYEGSMYLCVHLFETQGGSGTEVYLWCGDDVPEGSLEDAQLFARKVARENSCKLQVIRQGKEQVRFIQALGGIIITRRGSGSRHTSSALYMLCGRKHLGQMAFDEVDYSLRHLCSGFPYVISAPFGKLYLWKGKGSGPEETGAARLISMDLGLTGEFEEVEEGKEPESFFDVFAGSREANPHLSSDYWQVKPKYDHFGTRLLRVDHELGQPHRFWMRRPGSGSPVVRPNDTVQEVEPFRYKDLTEKGVYVLDTFFEIYVIVGEQAAQRSAEFASAVVFAHEYGILAASLQDRPFIPKSFVALGGVPDRCQSAFRKWDQQSLHAPCVFPLDVAIEAIRSEEDRQ